MKKKKPDIIKRFVYNFDKLLMKRPINEKYQYKVKPSDVKGPFIVASNRITSADQYLIMLSFSEYIHFTFNESIYRENDEIAKKHEFFGDIPYKIGCQINNYKDQILDLVKNGNNVCLYPEMYTNYSGITSPIDPDVADIIKEADCTLVTFCFSGGYFTEPTWAKNKRKGWCIGHIVNVYSKYDLAKLTSAQVTKLLEDDLKEDAYARQCNSPITYSGEGLAEGIENVLYTCCGCSEYDTIESSGKDYHCTNCEMRGSYTDQGIIHGNFRFKTITDYLKWEETQIDRIADSDIDFNEDDVTLSLIKDDHSIKELAKGHLHFDKVGMTIGDYKFDFEDIIKAEVDDKATSFVFSHGDKYYKLTKPGFRPLKYRKLFYKRKEAIRKYGSKQE